MCGRPSFVPLGLLGHAQLRLPSLWGGLVPRGAELSCTLAPLRWVPLLGEGVPQTLHLLPHTQLCPSRELPSPRVGPRFPPTMGELAGPGESCWASPWNPGQSGPPSAQQLGGLSGILQTTELCHLAPPLARDTGVGNLGTRSRNWWGHEPGCQAEWEITAAPWWSQRPRDTEQKGARD